MTQYYLLVQGYIRNAVLTAKSREEVAAEHPGYEVKTEDECTQAELEAYEYWGTRP